MQESVLALFGVSLAAALSEMLLPGEEHKGTKRSMRMLTALSVLLLLLPLGLLKENGILLHKEHYSFKASQYQSVESSRKEN